MTGKAPPERFYKLTRRVWDDPRITALPAVEQAVLTRLLIQGQESGRWQVDTSTRSMATVAGAGKTRINEAIQHLQSKGFLFTVHGPNGNAASTYRIASWLRS